jgi:phosphohistidine phosphatase SixA
MQAVTPHANERYPARNIYRWIIRRCARLALGATLTIGSAACARIQHVASAPVGALADSMTGADKKGSAPAAPVIGKLINDLQHGGYVIVFRHAPTNRDQADSDPLNYSDTTHQRLLSDKGVELAKKVGYALRELDIPVGRIYTSKFSRAVQTARLIGGDTPIATLDVTEGGLVATPIENDRRAAALRSLVAMRPEEHTNTVIVTHKPNLVDAFGADWVSSKDGEASVFKPDGKGGATLVARLQPQEWINAIVDHASIDKMDGNKSLQSQVYRVDSINIDYSWRPVP